MDQDDYDEFGNYIGRDADSDLNNDHGEDHLQGHSEAHDSQFFTGEDVDLDYDETGLEEGEDTLGEHEQRIVLAEDKKYYLDANEVYPGGVKTVLMDEDTQDVKEPIVNPLKVKNFSVLEKETPVLNYTTDFLTTLMDTPSLVRNVAIVGQFHHGKTTLLDTLVQCTQTQQQGDAPDTEGATCTGTTTPSTWYDGGKKQRYTDTRIDEQSREMSIKSTLMSLVLPALHEGSSNSGNGTKNYCLHLIDCPGHVNFLDEMDASLRLVDGAILVIDVIEGVMLSTKRAIIACIRNQVHITVCINKMDRLILELKLPPNDAYFKIKHTIDEINSIIVDNTLGSNIGGAGRYQQKCISPEKGNVCFASAQFGWSFTLQSFASMYCDKYKNTSLSHTQIQSHGTTSAEKGVKADQIYNTKARLNPIDLAPRLWGNWYYNKHTGNITKDKMIIQSGNSSTGSTRTFVELILEPLYKIYSHVLGDEPLELQQALKHEISIKLTTKETEMDPKPLLRLTLQKFFGVIPVGLVNMLVKHIDSPDVASARKVINTYNGYNGSYQGQGHMHDKEGIQYKNGNREGEGECEGEGEVENDIVHHMISCNSHESAPLIMHVTKLFNSPDGKTFLALARVYSGNLQNNGTTTVQILGESYSPHDTEDSHIGVIDNIFVGCGRFNIEISHVIAGNLILIEGIDNGILKSATLFDLNISNNKAKIAARINQNKIVKSNGNGNANANIDMDIDIGLDMNIFRKLSFDNISTIRIAIEPLKPSDLPKLIDALRCVCKSYPSVYNKVEESGEHVILVNGELSGDCVLHDIQCLYSDIEIRVSDPIVSFCETIIDSSALKCVSITPNKKNSLSMIAEPLDKGLGYDMEYGMLSCLRSNVFATNTTAIGATSSSFSAATTTDSKFCSDFLQKKYGWDLLSSRSVWGFGPQDPGGGGGEGVQSAGASPNLFLDDTLPNEVSKNQLNNIRDSIVQGFKWATREGPLCDEMIRNVKFKLIDATIATEPIYRGGGQIIPTARRTAYSAFLTATPRLMEPVYRYEIQAPVDVIKGVHTVLYRRRGKIVNDMPKAGAPFFTMTGYIPVLESFGFETDLRAYTQGQAFVMLTFDHWALVPGDPLDGDIILHSLEPSPAKALARDCMIKTRRRKGLSDDVSISKYFDDDMLEKIRGGRGEGKDDGNDYGDM